MELGLRIEEVGVGRREGEPDAIADRWGVAAGDAGNGRLPVDAGVDQQLVTEIFNDVDLGRECAIHEGTGDGDVLGANAEDNAAPAGGREVGEPGVGDWVADVSSVKRGGVAVLLNV